MLYRRGHTHNLLEHRCCLDFTAQHQVFSVELIFQDPDFVKSFAKPLLGHLQFAMGKRVFYGDAHLSGDVRSKVNIIATKGNVCAPAETQDTKDAASSDQWDVTAVLQIFS